MNFDKKAFQVETCYGHLELEHWEAIYMLYMHQFLSDYVLDNSKNPKVSAAAMQEGFVGFYSNTPKMSGEYRDGRGKYSYYWRWNQSRGQVIIKLPLLLYSSERETYYVKILKFNHRILHQKNEIYAYPRNRAKKIYKSWILEIYTQNSELLGCFYWCQHGTPSNNLENDILPFERVMEILNGLPDIDWDWLETELDSGIADIKQNHVEYRDMNLNNEPPHSSNITN